MGGEGRVFLAGERAKGFEHAKILFEFGACLRCGERYGDGRLLQHEPIPSRRRRNRKATRIVGRRTKKCARADAV